MTPPLNRHLRHSLLALAGILFLTACVATPVDQASAPAKAPVAAPVAEVNSPSSPDMQPAFKRILPKAEDLVGMSRVDLLSALGSPDFQRRDFGTEMLRFNAGACALDAFLYFGETGNSGGTGWRISHVETRTSSGQTVPATNCLEQLAARPLS